MKLIWEGNTKKSIYYGGFETGRRGRKVRSKKVNTKAKVVESVTWKTCATTAEGSTNVCFLYKQVTRRRRISRTEKIIVSFSATQNFDFCNQKIVIVSWQTSQNKDLYLQVCRNVGVILLTGGVHRTRNPSSPSNIFSTFVEMAKTLFHVFHSKPFVNNLRHLDS